MQRRALVLLALASAELSALGARVGLQEAVEAEAPRRATRKQTPTAAPTADEAPQARSGKGGRQASEEPLPTAPTRSGKGGQKEEPAVVPTPVAAAAEKPGQAMEEIRKRMRQERKALDGSMIPEFEAAAARVVELPAFQEAKVIRVHLNTRTYWIRLAALKAGKKLLVVQNMYEMLLVDPAKISRKKYKEAATPSGVKKFGVTVEVEDGVKVDLFVIASMAVNPTTGCRVGPPGSSEELEYGMLRQMGAMSKRTPVVTMADSYGLVKGMSFGNDALCSKVPADVICTAERTIEVRRRGQKLASLDFEKLGGYRMRTMRLLRRLRAISKAGTAEEPAPVPEKASSPSMARSGKGGRQAA